MQGKLGEDGLGLSQGFADSPGDLKPIQIASGSGGDDGGGGGLGPLPGGNGTGVAKKEDDTTVSWLLAGVFAFVGYTAYQQLFGDDK